MKNFLIFVLIVVLIVLLVIIGLKSCQNNNSDDGGILNLLPAESNVVIPDKIAIVQEIQKVGRLETAYANVDGVFTGERSQETLGGIFGEKLIFMAYAKVTAGIDLELLDSDDILIINSKSVKVFLPQAEIFDIVFDNNASYVVSRQTGLLSSVDSEMETQVRQEATKYLLQYGIDSGILPVAQQNAQVVISELLKKFGFEEIEFLSTDPSIEIKPIE
ncbi:MAG: DUF4230 domain-containing protein [Candidatus Shapirobacteria bacterium]|nr:DUF4230 domain-containing protein [Candidatus Shapirobacteria bacterium]